MIERFRHYVLVDHQARWRNDMISMVASLAWYLVSVAAGVSNTEAFKVSIELLVIAVAISTSLYVFSHRSAASAVRIDFSKRELFPRLALTVLVLVFIGLWTPVLEAAIIDKRLRKAMEGEPTQDKIAKAVQIVTEAQENNLRASPELITGLGQKILQSSTRAQLRDSAMVAASAFASYRSNLSPSPQVQSSIPASHSFSVNITCLSSQSKLVMFKMKEATDEDTTSPDTPIYSGIAGHYRLECWGCPRVMIQPDRQFVVPLTNVHARNVVFADGIFFYDGGAIKLESVQFLRSEFQISLAYGGSQNVQQFLAAVMTGQTVTLDLK